MSALLRVKPIKLSLWYQESVCNSVIVGVISSHTPIAFAGVWTLSVVASIHNSGVSARQELSVCGITFMKYVYHHLTRTNLMNIL